VEKGITDSTQKKMQKKDDTFYETAARNLQKTNKVTLLNGFRRLWLL
jgi:hypothetical protein